MLRRLVDARAGIGVGLMRLRARATLLAECLQRFDALHEIRGSAPLAGENIALREQRRDIAGQHLLPEPLRGKQHVRQTRMQRQARHGAPGFGDTPFSIHGVELDQ